VKQFIAKYGSLTTGVLSCFDRVVFRGHLSVSWARALEGLLFRQRVRIKDFGRWVERQSERVRQNAERIAGEAGRTVEYLAGSHERKEDLVRRIADQNGITEGLVVVLKVVEPCQSFVVRPGQGRPRLQPARRKCLTFYFYYLDREFGLMHVRIQSWFPLTIQVCLNGHDWLARQLTAQNIPFRQVDNAFVEIGDVGRARQLADRFPRLKWVRKLNAWARRVNPLLQDVLQDESYHWVIDQAEYATDVLFPDRQTLEPHYESWLRHATLCFSAEDVLTFLGRKLSGNFQGEVLTDSRRRWQGRRVKHRAKGNWIKMYDKFGRVLRVETVINQPREFRVRRWGTRQGVRQLGWFPLNKGVANFSRYAEICRAANGRYLDALCDSVDVAAQRPALEKLAAPARRNGRRQRGFNPAAKDDAALFAAVLRGEHALHGFKNEDVRGQLCGTRPRDPVLLRRQRQRVTRALQRLHAHGLIAKIPRTRRWRVTTKGNCLMLTTLRYHHQDYLITLNSLAT
jgi:hypothetical protein